MEYLISRINWKMMELFAAEDPAQIAHTQSVHDYTRVLAARSGCAERRIALLELAAILHDIGCPASRAKYGDSKPPHLVEEGARIVAEWLRECPELNDDEKKFIEEAVGSHHQFEAAKRLGFEPLFEADLAVNLLEGYYPRERAGELCEKLVTTAAGRELFHLLFGCCSECAETDADRQG